MARSSNVYILQRNDGEIIFAKTVKYELFACINHLALSREDLESTFRVIRMPDGSGGKPYIYDWSEIPEES